jgi:hypothetical protein
VLPFDYSSASRRRQVSGLIRADDDVAFSSYFGRAHPHSCRTPSHPKANEQWGYPSSMLWDAVSQAIATERREEALEGPTWLRTLSFPSLAGLCRDNIGTRIVLSIVIIIAFNLYEFSNVTSESGACSSSTYDCPMLYRSSLNVLSQRSCVSRYDHTYASTQPI